MELSRPDRQCVCVCVCVCVCACVCVCVCACVAFLFPPGVEHHLRELADVRLPDLVVHVVDGEGQAALRHADLPLHGAVWGPAARAAVYLELRDPGAHPRPLPQEEGALQRAGVQGRLGKAFLEGKKAVLLIQ